jgi:hypothetical protein
MDINTFCKTPEGVQMIQEQRAIFCIGGQLYQGYNQVPVEVSEVQLEDGELDAAIDVDGTKNRVWFARKQRLEGRYERKMQEYDKRRAMLREQRKGIVDGIMQAKASGIPASPDTDEELARIDDKMKRLADESGRERLRFARDRHDPVAAEARVEAEKAAVVATRVECRVCGVLSPEGHGNPPMWRRGHEMACKTKQAKAAS